MDTQKFKWSEIVVSALLIFFIAFFITYVVSFVYGFIVGFETRGDMEIMTARTIAFTSSLGFKIVMIALPGLVAFWRSKKIAQNVDEALMQNGLAAAGLWLIIRIIAGIVMPPFDPVRVIIEAVLVFGVMYLGLRSATK